MSQPNKPHTSTEPSEERLNSAGDSYLAIVYWCLYSSLLAAYRGANSLVSTGQSLPTVLRFGRFMDDVTKSLFLSMALPLIDGVFPALVLSGALSTPGGLLVIGATIFGGPWMLTIVLSEMAGDSRRARLRRIIGVALIVVPGAGVVAMLAPTLTSVLSLWIFTLFSAIVIFIVSLGVSKSSLAEYLPQPKWVVLVGLIASASVKFVTTGGVSPEFLIEWGLVIRAMSAAGVAFTLAGVAATIGPGLDQYLDFKRFRIGSGMALALIPVSIAGIIPSLSALTVFVLAILFALEL